MWCHYDRFLTPFQQSLWFSTEKKFRIYYAGVYRNQQICDCDAKSFSVKVSFLCKNAVFDENKFKYGLSGWKKLIARLKQENMDDAYL